MALPLEIGHNNESIRDTDRGPLAVAPTAAACPASVNEGPAHAHAAVLVRAAERADLLEIGMSCFDARVRPVVTIAAVAALLALSGCTPGSQPRHPPGSPSGSASRTSGATPRGSVLLDCGDYIGAHPPDSSLQVILGVVALPTSAAGPALQTAPTGGQPSSPRLFAKTGLLIKAGTDFQLVVPARAAGPVRDRMGLCGHTQPGRGGPPLRR